ncbi:hypothetical protein FRX31_005765, partial [Thalictrum thalictroides]
MLCARFFWNGPGMGKSMHHASVEKLGLRKEYGGLELRNFTLWNKAAYHGLVFNIVYRKPTLWVAWDILLWEDPWSSLGPLRKVPEAVSSWGALLPSNATLDSIIGNNSWQQSMFNHLPADISETLQK